MQEMFLIPLNSSRIRCIFSCIFDFPVFDTLSYLVTRFFQVLFLSSCSISPFFKKPSNLHIFIQNDLIIFFKYLFCCCCSAISIIFLRFCRIFIDSCRFIVALGTDCFIRNLVVHRLLRIHVVLGTFEQSHRPITSSVLCVLHLSQSYCLNRSLRSSPYYFEFCFGFCCSCTLSVRCCFSVDVQCILPSLASLLLLRCLHLFLGHAVQSLLYPSLLQLLPSELLLSHFLFFFCFSFLRLWGSSILILFQIWFCGCLLQHLHCISSVFSWLKCTQCVSKSFSAICRSFAFLAFFVHRVECCEVLYRQPLLHPVSSFVPLFECVRTNTDSLHSISWAQFGVEISSHNLWALVTGIRVLLDCPVHFLNVMVSIHRAEKVHAHQLDAMMVDHDLCCNVPCVDVFSAIDSLSPFLVQ